ncbi:relaxase/mobilization nuclease domain-containing protein [Rhodovulum marinum]|uniref:Relaxase/mobilization nuclease-like protein n=1 Tax=Rhodovulum marinum TaxID=320662 RepID=A0A4R2PX88_9RHOB|nr:relaxase/mobilization nuclease domain-containing protein [Rhodovulum marinum]TCP38791.1 relaxase/mobilization nuclease-like protein [Rhodovulum marinum]
MILKGSQRAGATQLSAHLLNERDNDHVELLELRGFVAEDLTGALREAQAISKATQCKQFMFSLSLNPPKEAVASEADFLNAADRAEKALGLDGQPRAIVIHEKEGRRHAHVVWSRIDAETMTAINLPHFKNRLTALSKELYLDFGWRLPEGLKTLGGKSPLNFTLDEWQQARRLKLDPREIKDAFRDAWAQSDSLAAMGNALAERGYFIARGDRRGFVALNIEGEVFALPKWIGVKTKEVRARFGAADGLPSVNEARAAIRSRLTTKLKAFIQEVNARHERDLAPHMQAKAEMVKAHRTERQTLKDRQQDRWQVEAQERSERYRKGLKGLLDKVTGKARVIRQENEAHALACAKRDREQRDRLAFAQMKDRQELQKQIDALRRKHVANRRLLARDITRYLRTSERSPETDADRSPRDRQREATPHRTRRRDRGPRFEL